MMDTGFFFMIYRKIVLTIVPLNAEFFDCEGKNQTFCRKQNNILHARIRDSTLRTILSNFQKWKNVVMLIY
jgi:hypothetical protein